MHRRLCHAFWLLAVALVGLPTTPLAAQPIAVQVQGVGVQDRVPAKGVSRYSGLFVELEDDGLGSGQFGYRRLFFHLHSPKALTADTQVTLRATVSDWSRSQNSVTVEVDGELLRGQTTGTITARIPQNCEWRTVYWDLWIDGQHDPELSRSRHQVSFVNNSDANRWQSGNMLELQAVGDEQTVTQSGARRLWLSRSSSSALNLQSVTGGLRENWLDYTPFDMVRIDFAEFQSLPEDKPNQWRALSAWVHAGGLLWVEEVGDDWQQLQRLHPHFGWGDDAEIEPNKPARNEQPGENGWSFVDIGRRNVDEGGQVQDFGPRPTRDPTNEESAAEPVYSEGLFVMRKFGWGSVVAFPDEPYSFSASSRRGLGDRSGRYWLSQSWPRRHGLMPGVANDDFSNWLIPGVGLAPVVSFQVLITLFVIAIGPANYWLLKRAGRLHLMVLTVPLAALAITLGLLAYGVLSDGIATQVRARSLTYLDQTEGRGTTWSRLSYYSALAPSGGLTFSDQAAVYPIIPGSIESADVQVTQRARRMEWQPGEQRLVSGWLPSRTPTQLLVVEPRSGEASLGITPSDEKVRVENGFKSTALMLAVVDRQGNWYWADNVASGATATTEAIEPKEAKARLRGLLMDTLPEFPPGFEAVEDSPLLQDRQRSIRRYYRRYGSEVTVTGMRAGSLNRDWQDLLGLEGTPAFELAPGSYVLVADRAPLPFSKDDFPIEDSSIHMIIGKW